MVEFFQTEKTMDLERLTTATLSKLEEIKERTATGILEASMFFMISRFKKSISRFKKFD